MLKHFWRKQIDALEASEKAFRQNEKYSASVWTAEGVLLEDQHQQHESSSYLVRPCQLTTAGRWIIITLPGQIATTSWHRTSPHRPQNAIHTDFLFCLPLSLLYSEVAQSLPVLLLKAMALLLCLFDLFDTFQPHPDPYLLSQEGRLTSK